MTKSLARVIINYKVNYNGWFVIVTEIQSRFYLRGLFGWGARGL